MFLNKTSNHTPKRKRNNHKFDDFTPFSIKVANIHQEVIEQNKQFTPFKIVVKNCEENQEEMQFNSFKIKIAQYSETSSDFQTNNNEQNNFLQFTKTRYRNSHHGSIIDLKVCDLREVIEFMTNEKMINSRTLFKFELYYKENKEMELLSLLEVQKQNNTQNKSSEIAYSQLLEQTIFSLIDHRIFCEILFSHFPQTYQMTEIPRCFISQTSQYLQKIYRMTQQEYFNLFDEFNVQYNRFWMPTSRQLFQTPSYFIDIINKRNRSSSQLLRTLNLKKN